MMDACNDKVIANERLSMAAIGEIRAYERRHRPVRGLCADAVGASRRRSRIAVGLAGLSPFMAKLAGRGNSANIGMLVRNTHTFFFQNPHS
jgi:hypothetical protein